MEKRNKLLEETKAKTLNKVVHSTINDMRPIITRHLKHDINISNIEKSKYDKLVEIIIPELSQAVKSPHVRKVLGYPVVIEEAKRAVRNDKLQLTLQELTDKIENKLVRQYIFSLSPFQIS